MADCSAPPQDKLHLRCQQYRDEALLDLKRPADTDARVETGGRVAPTHHKAPITPRQDLTPDPPRLFKPLCYT
ncbi:unnamed protein product [Lota lota]